MDSSSLAAVSEGSLVTSRRITIETDSSSDCFSFSSSSEASSSRVIVFVAIRGGYEAVRFFSRSGAVETQRGDEFGNSLLLPRSLPVAFAVPPAPPVGLPVGRRWRSSPVGGSVSRPSGSARPEAAPSLPGVLCPTRGPVSESVHRWKSLFSNLSAFANAIVEVRVRTEDHCASAFPFFQKSFFARVRRSLRAVPWMFWCASMVSSWDFSGCG